METDAFGRGVYIMKIRNQVGLSIEPLMTNVLMSKDQEVWKYNAISLSDIFWERFDEIKNLPGENKLRHQHRYRVWWTLKSSNTKLFADWCKVRAISILTDLSQNSLKSVVINDIKSA